MRLRVDHGSLVVQNGFTHYPQERGQWRFFPGEWRLPSRIVLLDVDGAISFDALGWLSAQHIPLVQIDWRGEVLHVTGGTGHVFDREAIKSQLMAQKDGRGFKFAQRLITEKIANSIDTLRQSFPNGPATEMVVGKLAYTLGEMKRRPPRMLSDLLGIEGRAGLAYFAGWQFYPLRWRGIGRHPIPEDWKRIGKRLSRVSGRNHRNRHATHPVNAMLNYAYAMLESRVRMQVLASGLDPTIGYLHGSYRGKEALVLDLMEPLRPVVDRGLLALVRQHVFEPGDFTLTNEGVCRLNPQLTRAVAQQCSVDTYRGPTFLPRRPISPKRVR